MTTPQDNGKDPLEFAKAVRDWMATATDQINEFKEQVGMPTLGIDANALNALNQIAAVLDEARRNSELPEEEQQ